MGLGRRHLRGRRSYLLAWALVVSSARIAPAGVLLPPERPQDPPGVPAAVSPRGPVASSIAFGRFTSVQVNVSATGANIVGDAANEPTIAVDPFDHGRMTIGWRQFDTISSNFRQAGFAFSTNGGASWTAGKIQPGVFRSDPVLGVDAEGDVFYLSLDSQLHTQLFPSSDHGATWGAAISALGGDKPWIAFDRTGGPGNDHAYEAWSTSGDSYYPNTFSRSIDDGASFQTPDSIPDFPTLGTIDTGPDGTVYVVGTDTPGGPFVLSRSTDASNAVATPTFTSMPLDLGGNLGSGDMNPAGLLGQPWIAVDRSGGPRTGWIYVLCSVWNADDPLDVHFIRSTDGGVTWSTPVRVNDDPTGDRAFQWFGTMSVSPDGRIDAVWNDTRGSADSTQCALYYSYSADGGTTWSPNEQVTPTWKATVGWPKQNKIGDYYQMISDADGADLAYAATFNGEEDVYYVRLTRPMTAADAPHSRGLHLLPGVPNPVRSSTTIGFDVPGAGARVILEVLDASGRRVRTLAEGPRSGGVQRVVWDGTDAAGHASPPGVYLVRLRAAGVEETRRLVRVR